MIDTVIIYSPKVIEGTIPRVVPYVNYGLLVIIRCQCTFISSNKWTTLVGDADNGETMHVGGGEDMESFCIFLSILLWTYKSSKTKSLKLMMAFFESCVLYISSYRMHTAICWVLNHLSSWSPYIGGEISIVKIKHPCLAFLSWQAAASIVVYSKAIIWATDWFHIKQDVPMMDHW